MTAYFDDLNTCQRELSTAFRDDGAFVEALADLEDRVIQTVSLATGDREFPDDLRQKIQGLISLWRIRTPIIANSQAIEYAKALKQSRLLDRLHSIFHDVASRRHVTRFGVLLDSPEDIVKRRDAHDSTVAR